MTTTSQNRPVNTARGKKAARLILPALALAAVAAPMTIGAQGFDRGVGIQPQFQERGFGFEQEQRFDQERRLGFGEEQRFGQERDFGLGRERDLQFNQERGVQQFQQPGTLVQPGRRAQVDAILDNPRQFIGQTVSVVAEVDRVLSDRAFTVEDEDLFFDDELLVVTWQSLAQMLRQGTVPNQGAVVGQMAPFGRDGRFDQRGQFGVDNELGRRDQLRERGDATGVDRQRRTRREPLRSDDEVQITGVVQMFDAAQIRQQLGIAVDTDRVFSEFRNKPVLIAQVVQLAPAGAIRQQEQARVDQRQPLPQQPQRQPGFQPNQGVILQPVPRQQLQQQPGFQQGQGMTTQQPQPMQQGQISGVLSPDQVERQARQLANRQVTVRGEVTDVINANAFALGEAVLVITRQPFPSQVQGTLRDSLYEQNTAQVTGTVRLFTNRQELERELGIQLRGRAFDDWTGRPVIIASSVQSR
ncbi:MAG TPA: hypothetical protein VGW38_24820 [Chloroflexota bacterium]|nr:hypothetical protein [Chloroflexota bacterium]